MQLIPWSKAHNLNVNSTPRLKAGVALFSLLLKIEMPKQVRHELCLKTSFL